MCTLIFMDVVIRALVIIVFLNFLLFFVAFRRKSQRNFTIGLLISLIASIIFLFEGIQLFQGVSDLARLPLCLLVIGIWGISFYFYYLHFSINFNSEKYKWHKTGVILLVILNFFVAISGLFLIIPESISLVATGLTTTILGTFTFSLPAYISLRSLITNKTKNNLLIASCTALLASGNLTFLVLTNYAVALEIIIVSIVILSLNYMLNHKYQNNADIRTVPDHEYHQSTP